LTKYTGVLVLPGLALAVLLAAAPRRDRARALFLVLGPALALGAWPYVTRFRLYGDPFVGNWDDALGHPYRQPPGFRIAPYFVRFGASLFAHPFEARKWSLWDSLYVSWFGDGFARFIATPIQHPALLLLAWLALPLLVAMLAGALAIGFGRARPAPL